MKLTASRPDPLTGSGFFHPLVPLASWLALALMLPLWPGPCQLLMAGLMAPAGWLATASGAVAGFAPGALAVDYPGGGHELECARPGAVERRLGPHP